MQIYTSIAALKAFDKAIVTIGTFDGVHQGHQKILAQLKTVAKEVGGETVVITFHPHPRKVVGDTSGVKLLNTLEEKQTLLAQAGVDHLVVIPFDESFANLSAEAYVKDFLYQYFKPHTLIIGYDHRFGKGRKGDYQLLELMGKELGFNVQEINAQLIEEAAISSTRARKALLQHDLITAKNLLGYTYFFEGIVIQGDQIGRTIGYPTANLQLLHEEKLVPGDGVYAVQAKGNWQSPTDALLQGMMYIGSRPVVNGKRRVIEVNLFDFNEDIYGCQLQVFVAAYIRGDMNFNGLEALKIQLALDQQQSIAVLNS